MLTVASPEVWGPRPLLSKRAAVTLLCAYYRCTWLLHHACAWLLHEPQVELLLNKRGASPLFRANSAPPVLACCTRLKAKLLPPFCIIALFCDPVFVLSQV